MTSLLDLKQPRARFARSINVERDAGSSAVDSYLPVGRAIDALERLTSALERHDVEVALSITGPYGSGKSSLAVIIDALLGPSSDPARKSAEDLLGAAAPDTLRRLTTVRRDLGAHRQGFIRAVVTAQREPITTTVLRALSHGLNRYSPTARDKAALTRARRALTDLANAAAAPDARAIRRVITETSEIAPVLLLIDEFGKNLEAFADRHAESDLFLLQELAEWTRATTGGRFAVVTMQHLAFAEYAGTVSPSERREWAKVQGRFEDIPFVDTSAQTRALVAAAFEDTAEPFTTRQNEWAAAHATTLRKLGLTDLAKSEEVLARCWPLHPLSLGALPELCERYGQNERTLFSFLAGHEPLSVARFLEDNPLSKPSAPLPEVRLHHLYDYFIESASNLAAVSTNASRWLEIDTRVRDASGISEPARRVLKTVGLLNLISAGGQLRASSALLTYALQGDEGMKTRNDVIKYLVELENAGLVTFRDFADEYRVWQGSDFDLRTAIDSARRGLHDIPAADLLDRILPLAPIVAARHSHRGGTLRSFLRRWTSPAVESITPLAANDLPDGLAVYVLGQEAPVEALTRREGERPTVFVTAAGVDHLVVAAVEVAAIDEVLANSADVVSDHVAKRELQERRVVAMTEVEQAFHASFGSENAVWTTTKRGRRRWTTRSTHSPSSVISDVCDDWYALAPAIRNDLITRHELSSQAAKARRMLIEAMASHEADEGLAIDGFGPDRTLYLSVLSAPGLHQQTSDGRWEFGNPPIRSELAQTWSRLHELIANAKTSRVSVADIYLDLSVPPFGVRAGVAPILLAAALLAGREEIALYEHGTFRPTLSEDVIERFIRNPANFELKHYASGSGPRAALLTRLVEALGVSPGRLRKDSRVRSVLGVVSHLVAFVNTLPEYSKRTSTISADAAAMRSALLAATEPDELIFRLIPEALGFAPIPATARVDDTTLTELSARIVAARDELANAFPTLLANIEAAVHRHVAPNATSLRDAVAGRAAELAGKIIDPRVARLAVALEAEIPEHDAWLAYVALNVSGVPPEGWNDTDRDNFFTAIADVGGTFSRLHALNANLDAKTDGFDAYRTVLTTADGTEIVNVVAIDDETRRVAIPAVDAAIAAIAKQLRTSPAETRALIVGLLGEADLAERTPDASIAPAADDVAYGDPVKRSAKQ